MGGYQRFQILSLAHPRNILSATHGEEDKTVMKGNELHRSESEMGHLLCSFDHVLMKVQARGAESRQSPRTQPFPRGPLSTAAGARCSSPQNQSRNTKGCVLIQGTIKAEDCTCVLEGTLLIPVKCFQSPTHAPSLKPRAEDRGSLKTNSAGWKRKEDGWGRR